MNLFLSGFISSLPQLAWKKRLCCCCCCSILGLPIRARGQLCSILGDRGLRAAGSGMAPLLPFANSRGRRRGGASFAWLRTTVQLTVMIPYGASAVAAQGTGLHAAQTAAPPGQVRCACARTRPPHDAPPSLLHPRLCVALLLANRRGAAPPHGPHLSPRLRRSLRALGWLV